MITDTIDHVVLTVSDLARARHFYGEVLGLALHDDPDYLGGSLYFMVGDVQLYLVRHAATPPGDRFSEFRVGLDHLAFAAPDEAALRALAERLVAAGVPSSGVQVYAPGGKRYVAFRDPDNIQLEYWLDEPVAP